MVNEQNTIVSAQSTITDKEKIELAKWIFERTLGWIAAADGKVGVILAIDTAMVAGLAAAITASEAQSRTVWAYLAIIFGTVGLVLAIFCAAMAAIPRIFGPDGSIIFFIRIAEKTATEYTVEFSKTNGC